MVYVMATKRKDLDASNNHNIFSKTADSGAVPLRIWYSYPQERVSANITIFSLFVRISLE